MQYDENNQSIDLADQTRDGNTTDSGFIKNDISKPEHIMSNNGKIYISDSGIKCIQEFKFEINEGKGNIVGIDVLIASECGEVGRFNQNSNIDFDSNTLVVCDSNNRRIQVLKDNEVTNYDIKTFTGTTDSDLNNLNTAHIVDDKIFFTTYNINNSTQNIFEYDIEFNSLSLLPHSVSKIFDSCKENNNIYYVSANGLYSLNTTTGLFKRLNSTMFAENARISISDSTIVISNHLSLNVYNITGGLVKTTNLENNVSDIAFEGNNLYVLQANNNVLSRFELNRDTFSLTLMEDLSANHEANKYYSMTIDNASGIIYLFDNNACKIDRLINPTFNFKQNRGIYQVNNKNVCIYDKPYFLNGIDSPTVLTKLNVNDRVNIYSTTNISFGNIDYYIVELEGNTYGYINKNDLTYLKEVINYEVVLPNASLRSFDESGKITVYKEADTNSEIIAKADEGTRILILEEEINPDFIKIKYYDNDQNLIIGYVETNLVNHDALTKDQITAIILIVSSIILLTIIIITVLVIHKKKSKRLKTVD